jgi:hypothetical protein
MATTNKGSALVGIVVSVSVVVCGVFALRETGSQPPLDANRIATTAGANDGSVTILAVNYFMREDGHALCKLTLWGVEGMPSIEPTLEVYLTCPSPKNGLTHASNRAYRLSELSTPLTERIVDCDSTLFTAVIDATSLTANGSNLRDLPVSLN